MTDWLDKLRGTAAEVEAEPPPRPPKAQDGKGGPPEPRIASLKSDEYVAYLNAMTSIDVLLKDGSRVTTMLTPDGLDRVLAKRRAEQRKK